VLTTKVKDIANKPMNKTTKKRPVRTEKLPTEPEQTQEEKKQEIEDMLIKLRA
jgi:hypothetical protein